MGKADPQHKTVDVCIAEFSFGLPTVTSLVDIGKKKSGTDKLSDEVNALS